MATFIYFIFGVIVGGAIVWFWMRSSAPKGDALIKKQAQEKENNLGKMLELFKSKDKVTNDDIGTLLGVSDATATRYLDELEQQGHIRQVGPTGQGVYYVRITQ